MLQFKVLQIYIFYPIDKFTSLVKIKRGPYSAIKFTSFIETLQWTVSHEILLGLVRRTIKTSGIPGGYRLVSTYDLLGCKTILKFEIWRFSDLGGVFWNSRIWTLWQFSFLGGILKLLDLDSVTIFIGGGGILKLLDLDSLTIFILGGYSETLGFGLSDNFHLWGGGGYSVLQNRGILRNLDQNFNHSSRLMHHR